MIARFHLLVSRQVFITLSDANPSKGMFSEWLVEKITVRHALPTLKRTHAEGLLIP